MRAPSRLRNCGGGIGRTGLRQWLRVREIGSMSQACFVALACRDDTCKLFTMWAPYLSEAISCTLQKSVKHVSPMVLVLRPVCPPSTPSPKKNMSGKRWPEKQNKTVRQDFKLLKTNKRTRPVPFLFQASCGVPAGGPRPSSSPPRPLPRPPAPPSQRLPRPEPPRLPASGLEGSQRARVCSDLGPKRLAGSSRPTRN